MTQATAKGLIQSTEGITKNINELHKIRRDLLDNPILHIDVSMERLVIVHDFATFDQKSITLVERQVMPLNSFSCCLCY